MGTFDALQSAIEAHSCGLWLDLLEPFIIPIGCPIIPTETSHWLIPDHWTQKTNVQMQNCYMTVIKCGFV